MLSAGKKQPVQRAGKQKALLNVKGGKTHPSQGTVAFIVVADWLRENCIMNMIWLENLPTAFWNQINLLGKNFVEHV